MLKQALKLTTHSTGMLGIIECLFDLPEDLWLAKHHGEKAGTLLESWTENWLKPQFRNWNIEHYLPDIQCPTLVIQGEDDEFATISQVESICSKISGPAVPCVLADIGHIPHKAAREEVLNVVEKFILRYCV